MNNPKSSTAPVVMDARKFVRQINNSVAAKLKFFEESVARMGQNVGKNFRLTSIDNKTLIYEDVDKNVYYLADIQRLNRGKLQLENIRPIQVVEEDKASQFDKNINDLVNNICEGNLSQADKIFNKIESQRFRSRVIPESGWITLKDDVSRHVNVSTRIVQEDRVRKIINLFTEAVKDTVELERGRVVRGTLSDGKEKFIVPINEYTRRRLVAYKMRDAAYTAYKSSAFQELVTECASLVCEGQVDKAVRVAAKFLKEEQEFSLLNMSEMTTLIENTLATRAEFNSMLAEDVAKLFYKTNAKMNRESILEAWAKVAQTSNHSGLLTNVNILAESEDFNEDYERFLDIVFNEEADVQSLRAKAYRTTLRVIASILPDLDDSEDGEVSASVDEVNNMIEMLSGPEPDSKALLQAEELLAGISDSLINSVQDLESFDSVPGEEEAEGEVEGEEGDEELFPMAEVPDEGEEGEEGEEMPMPPMPEEGEEGPPRMEESVQRRLVPVEQMKVSNLNEELEDWKVHGDAFLREYGYEQCYGDMKRYINRCIEIGPKASVLRESFENMRDCLVSTGDAILEDIAGEEDPYFESLVSAMNGSNKILSKRTKKDPENDPAFWGKEGKVKSEGRINRNYRHTYMEGEQPYEMSGGLSDASGLRMDDLRGSGGVAQMNPSKSDGRSAGGSAAGYHAPQRGQGTAKKGVKPVDGRKGEHSTRGAAGGSTRMDDLQGGGGVQKQGLGSTDGRTGHSRSATSSESTVAAHGGVPSTDLSMGSDFQGRGGVVPKSLQKGSGASGDGASSAKSYTASGGPSSVGHDMSEYQGSDGVEDDSLDADPHKGQGRVKSDGGLKKSKRGGDMAGSQGSGGVAESLTPERIAALISEMEDSECEDCCEKCDCDPCECPVSEEAQKGTCEDCGKPNFICKCDGDSKPDDGSDNDGPPASEDQYKGPSRKYKSPGYAKSSLNPSEGKEKSKNALNEEKVAAFVGSPDSVAAAVDRALSGMDDMGDDMVADTGEADVLPPPAEEEPMGDLGDMGDEEDSVDLESALDTALSGDDEGDDLEDEVDTDDGDDEEMAMEGSGDSKSSCDDCGKVVCECG